MAILPFEKWGIDFVGPITPSSTAQKRYIIIATDYFTKCSEAHTTQKDDAKESASFLLEQIIRIIRLVFHEKIALYRRGKMSKTTGYIHTNRQTRNLQDFQYGDIILY